MWIVGVPSFVLHSKSILTELRNAARPWRPPVRELNDKGEKHDAL
jgi:hypothetical protein